MDHCAYSPVHRLPTVYIPPELPDIPSLPSPNNPDNPISDDDLIAALKTQNDLLREQNNALLMSNRILSDANTFLQNPRAAMTHRKIEHIKEGLRELKERFAGKLSEARQAVLKKMEEIVSAPDFEMKLMLGIAGAVVLAMVILAIVAVVKGGPALGPEHMEKLRPLFEAAESISRL